MCHRAVPEAPDKDPGPCNDGRMDGWMDGGREGGREGGMDGWMDACSLSLSLYVEGSQSMNDVYTCIHKAVYEL